MTAKQQKQFDLPMNPFWSSYYCAGFWHGLVGPGGGACFLGDSGGSPGLPPLSQWGLGGQLTSTCLCSSWAEWLLALQGCSCENKIENTSVF